METGMRLNDLMQVFSSVVLVALLCAGQTAVRGDEKGTVLVGMEELIGGTGESAGQVIRNDLNGSGVLRIQDGAGLTSGRWLLRGSSSAGRIDGALLDAKGTVIFNNHYDEPDLRDNAHAFSDDVVTAITGGRGMAATKIAFVSRRSGAPEIYLADSDGERTRQVTGGGGLKGAPALAPGRRRG